MGKAEQYFFIPRSEELKQRMRNAGLYGENPREDQAWNSMINYLTSREETTAVGICTGFMMEIERAKADPKSNLISIKTMYAHVYDFFDAIIPDPAIVQEAKDIFRQAYSASISDMLGFNPADNMSNN